MSYIILNWEFYKIRENGDIELRGANFSGPGIKDSYQLLPQDNINLDFTEYYSGKNAIDSFYTVRFFWNGARYDGTYYVYFKEAILKNVNFDLFGKIRKRGFIKISLEGHNETEHYKNIFYKAEVDEY